MGGSTSVSQRDRYTFTLFRTSIPPTQLADRTMSTSTISLTLPLSMCVTYVSVSRGGGAGLDGQTLSSISGGDKNALRTLALVVGINFDARRRVRPLQLPLATPAPSSVAVEALSLSFSRTDWCRRVAANSTSVRVCGKRCTEAIHSIIRRANLIPAEIR